MSLHLEVLGSSGRRHTSGFSSLLFSIQRLFSTRVAFCQSSVCGEIEKREIRGLLTRRGEGLPYQVD